MSLYLKYRPQDFATMVGQKHATQTIQNALRNKALAHAYLFCGPRGTGKTSLARIVAKAINCQNLTETSEPCNECNICTAIQEGRMVDLIEIDAASNRGIDEIRELREKITFSPSQAKAKVYIIDEVHMLTKEAFNALLKTLEEPPEHAYFVLATTEAHKIPETIISRCQQFTFKRIDLDSITNRLETIAKQEGVNSEKNALQLIAKASNGGLRDAIGLFEQLATEGEVNEAHAADRLGLTGNAFIEEFFAALVDQKPLEAVEIINQVNSQGKNLNQFATEVIGFLREQMLIQIHDARLCKQMMNWIDIFNEARLKLGQASIPQLPLEMAVIRMCGFESKDEASPKDLNQKTINPTAGEDLNHDMHKSYGEQDSNLKDHKGANVKMDMNELDRSKNEISKNAGEKTFSRLQDEGKDQKSADLTLESLQKNWPRVLEHIQTPFVKMSLMDGRLIDYQDGAVSLEFNSTTLMEKVQTSKNHSEVLEAMEEVFKSKLELKMEVKKIQLTPHPKDEPEVKEIKQASKSDSMVDMAGEVFGVSND